MSVLIPGMEMPTVRDTLVLIQTNGTAIVYEDEAYVTTAIPVPEHGRLIDADALTGQMERNLWTIEDKAEKELGFDETLRRGMQFGHAVCVDAVNAAPTIIPAEEGEG